MRLARPVVAMALAAALAVATVVLSADPSERQASASERPTSSRADGPDSLPPTAYTLAGRRGQAGPRTPTAVGPTTPAGSDGMTPAGVDRTTPAGVDRATPAHAGRAPSSVVVRKTSAAGSIGPARVNLGTASTFAVLTKSGVTDVFASRITGNVGASPITGASVLLTCAEVTGTIFSVNAAGPAPCRVTDAARLTTAVSDEERAYTDAAGRTSPGFVNLGAGQIGGLTLAPSLYRWTGPVLISGDVTLAGGPHDVWIFQIAGSVTQASATRVRLTGGAQAKNVFWQVAGAVTIGTAAHSEGTILTATMVAMNTGASMNGRLLAQTAVTLQKNTITNVQ